VSTKNSANFSHTVGAVDVGIHGVVDAVLISILHSSLESSFSTAIVNSNSTAGHAEPTSKLSVAPLTISTLGVYKLHTAGNLSSDVVNSLGSISEADLRTLCVAIHISSSRRFSDFYRNCIDTHFKIGNNNSGVDMLSNVSSSSPIVLYVDFVDECGDDVSESRLEWQNYVPLLFECGQ
jgi:hypothetical protein